MEAMLAATEVAKAKAKPAAKRSTIHGKNDGKPRDLLEQVRHDIALQQEADPLGRRNLHQQARHKPPPSHAYFKPAEKKPESEDDDDFGEYDSRSPSKSSKTSKDGAESRKTFRRKSSLKINSGELAFGEGEKVPSVEEVELFPEDLEPAESAKVEVRRRCGRVSVVDIGHLPAVFTKKIDLPRMTDSPFSSALPLPRKLAESVLLRDCDAHYEEGSRCLRRLDYEGARAAMERAWEVLERELSLEDEGIAKDAPDAYSSDSELGSDFGAEEPSPFMKHQAAEAVKRATLIMEERQCERDCVEKEYKLALGLDLTLIYSRLQDWANVDELSGNVLDFFGPPGEFPQFESEEDEEQWCQLMVRRGVACAFLGADEFPRAEAYFADVVVVRPRNRDAKRGMECIRFLGSQLQPGDDDSAMLAALAKIG